MIERFYVDGYAEVDGRKIIFEYNGCAYHDCERCKTARIHEKDEFPRKQYFRNLPNSKIISISGCEWYIEKLDINFENYKPEISPFLFERKADVLDFVSLVEDGSLYGFMVVDLDKTEDAEKWCNINWPPIFQKDDVHFNDLPGWMQELFLKEEFPKTTILQKMHAKQLLLHTSLLKFYLENGFEITKIHKFYEYQGARCFAKVFKSVYEARVQATETHDEMKATAVKLVSNAMYGSLLLVSIIQSLNLQHPHGPHYPHDPHRPHVSTRSTRVHTIHTVHTVHLCPHSPHGPHIHTVHTVETP